MGISIILWHKQINDTYMKEYLLNTGDDKAPEQTPPGVETKPTGTI